MSKEQQSKVKEAYYRESTRICVDAQEANDNTNVAKPIIVCMRDNELALVVMDNQAYGNVKDNKWIPLTHEQAEEYYLAIPDTEKPYLVLVRQESAVNENKITILPFEGHAVLDKPITLELLVKDNEDTVKVTEKVQKPKIMIHAFGGLYSMLFIDGALYTVSPNNLNPNIANIDLSKRCTPEECLEYIEQLDKDTEWKVIMSLCSPKSSCDLESQQCNIETLEFTSSEGETINGSFTATLDTIDALTHILPKLKELLDTQWEKASDVLPVLTSLKNECDAYILLSEAVDTIMDGILDGEDSSYNQPSIGDLYLGIPSANQEVEECDESSHKKVKPCVFGKGNGFEFLIIDDALYMTDTLPLLRKVFTGSMQACMGEIAPVIEENKMDVIFGLCGMDSRVERGVGKITLIVNNDLDEVIVKSTYEHKGIHKVILATFEQHAEKSQQGLLIDINELKETGMSLVDLHSLVPSLSEGDVCSHGDTQDKLDVEDGQGENPYPYEFAQEDLLATTIHLSIDYTDAIEVDVYDRFCKVGLYKGSHCVAILDTIDNVWYENVNGTYPISATVKVIKTIVSTEVNGETEEEREVVKVELSSSLFGDVELREIVNVK